jgi:hypothetical protein
LASSREKTKTKTSKPLQFVGVNITTLTPLKERSAVCGGTFNVFLGQKTKEITHDKIIYKDESHSSSLVTYFLSWIIL